MILTLEKLLYPEKTFRPFIIVNEGSLVNLLPGTRQGRRTVCTAPIQFCSRCNLPDKMIE